ncbi:hypothetical protein Sgleb_07460 [Streptomyces glebosus]|uniref:Uncharacterized protein n=1 Tax=Streptomyces glebosus TaxID=249580 RepID=A0A640SML5_9ACTN|nr:hypothetical protein Sgleb_07460 [Streptomyces glebosus]GHG75079.1 hypothetical protein GCM10010513_49380 [Streptomyces glebosus]
MCSQNTQWKHGRTPHGTGHEEFPSPEHRLQPSIAPPNVLGIQGWFGALPQHAGPVQESHSLSRSQRKFDSHGNRERNQNRNLSHYWVDTPLNILLSELSAEFHGTALVLLGCTMVAKWSRVELSWTAGNHPDRTRGVPVGR